MDKDLLDITFEADVEDHTAAEILHLKTTPRWKIARIASLSLFAIGAGSVLYTGNMAWALIWLPLGLGELFLWRPFRKLRIFGYMKQNPELTANCRVLITNQGLEFISGGKRSRAEWSGYTGLVEDGSVFVLLRRGWNYSVLPKRGFSRPEDEKRFLDLAREKLSRPAEGP